MRVHMFWGRGHQGYALSATGRELPAEFGPWRFFKIVNMTEGADRPDRVLSSVREHGYYIQQSRGPA